MGMVDVVGVGAGPTGLMLAAGLEEALKRRFGPPDLSGGARTGR